MNTAVQVEALRLNACELEIDLFCRGLRVPDEVSLDGARAISTLRRGLGSGLEIVLPTGSRIKQAIWVNVPVAEPFAARSPYRLGNTLGGYVIVDERSGQEYDVRVPGEPAWCRRLTSRDVGMGSIGTLRGTTLTVCVSAECAFWKWAPRANCRFCSAGWQIGVDTAPVSVSDVVETCWASRDESDSTFVMLTGGFDPARGTRFLLPYIRAIKENVGMLVGVQLALERDLGRYDELVDAGVDYLSFCPELLNPEWFARICPGKARSHGWQQMFDAMRHCAGLLPRGAVAGQLIAGIEPIENTLEAIDLLADGGIVPTAAVFRPQAGADMEHWPPPAFADMRRVMAHLYSACLRQWLPVGVAPHVEFSTVVDPCDAALLVERSMAFYTYETFRRVVRKSATPVFIRRLKARARPARV